MDITNQYLLDCATEIAKQNPAACILDFGCGNGAVVSAGRQRNLDIYGAEVLYGGSAARSEVERAGLLGTVVREIQNGVAEFDDASFDLVMNNQVFEHVADLDSVLQETARLLKPTGLLLSIFPAIDVIREGHIGIPFAHWFPKRSRKSRFLYTYGLRCLGLGKYKDNFTSRAEWVRFELEWLDTYTYYRPKEQIMDSFNRFYDSEFREKHYIQYRSQAKPTTHWIVPLLHLPLASAIASKVFQKLAFMVIVSTKRHAIGSTLSQATV